MPARTLALGAGRWMLLLIGALIVGYFIYLLYKISASLHRVAGVLAQMRLDQAARKEDQRP